MEGKRKERRKKKGAKMSLSTTQHYQEGETTQLLMRTRKRAKRSEHDLPQGFHALHSRESKLHSPPPPSPPPPPPLLPSPRETAAWSLACPTEISSNVITIGSSVVMSGIIFLLLFLLVLDEDRLFQSLMSNKHRFFVVSFFLSVTQ